VLHITAAATVSASGPAKAASAVIMCPNASWAAALAY
jgi:hypothetical protein